MRASASFFYPSFIDQSPPAVTDMNAGPAGSWIWRLVRAHRVRRAHATTALGEGLDRERRRCPGTRSRRVDRGPGVRQHGVAPPDRPRAGSRGARPAPAMSRCHGPSSPRSTPGRVVVLVDEPQRERAVVAPERLGDDREVPARGVDRRHDELRGRRRIGRARSRAGRRSAGSSIVALPVAVDLRHDRRDRAALASVTGVVVIVGGGRGTGAVDAGAGGCDGGGRSARDRGGRERSGGRRSRPMARSTRSDGRIRSTRRRAARTAAAAMIRLLRSTR